MLVDSLIAHLRARGPCLLFMGGPVHGWHFDPLYDELCQRVRRRFTDFGIMALPCTA